MKREAGLWIDHRQAVIVTLLDKGEEIKRITSDIERHVRYSGASHSQNPEGHDDSSENRRDRRYDDELDRYYDKVIDLLHDTDSILILGPGEAKGEIEKRFEKHQVGGRVVVLETADKLTDGQIAAQVRHHFGR